MSDKPITHDIKERLGKYTRLLREIDNQYERLGRMEISMAAPPGPDMTGMPRGSGTPTDRTGMMVLRKMELEEQIEERLAEEREERAALEAMIRQVETLTSAPCCGCATSTGQTGTGSAPSCSVIGRTTSRG